jgi:hypothetical protein
VDAELQNLKSVINANVDAINKMIKDKGIEMVMVKKHATDM